MIRQTKHMFGRTEFQLMKPDAILINTSRGAVVDETALIEALQSQKIGSAGLDVFETEPLPKDSPLWRLENVLLPLHMAGSPERFKFHSKRYQFFAESIKGITQGRTPINVVNRF